MYNVVFDWIMSGWTEGKVKVVAAAVMLLAIVFGAIPPILQRYFRDKRGPWTL